MGPHGMWTLQASPRTGLLQARAPGRAAAGVHKQDAAPRQPQPYRIRRGKVLGGTRGRALLDGRRHVLFAQLRPAARKTLVSDLASLRRGAAEHCRASASGPRPSQRCALQAGLGDLHTFARATRAVYANFSSGRTL